MKPPAHLQMAKLIWSAHLRKGDCVIDATCGNGYDTLFLANAILTHNSGILFAIDKQPQAVETAQKRLSESLPETCLDRIVWQIGCHSMLPTVSPRLIVYNLGYLPGSDKQEKTSFDTTLKSLKSGLEILPVEGMISVTFYPGHEGGELERATALKWARELDYKTYQVNHTCWINRENAPSLLIITKH